MLFSSGFLHVSQLLSLLVDLEDWSCDSCMLCELWQQLELPHCHPASVELFPNSQCEAKGKEISSPANSKCSHGFVSISVSLIDVGNGACISISQNSGYLGICLRWSTHLVYSHLNFKVSLLDEELLLHDLAVSWCVNYASVTFATIVLSSLSRSCWTYS